MDHDLIYRILDGLNEEQRAAVTAPARGQLQIVAGPGTGKTKVLTSRVAYLLIHEKIQPWQMVVTTFTRKAAKEMKDRLAMLLEGSHVPFDKLHIGTFHSICIKVLRKYGKEVGLDQKFIVASTKDISDILDTFLDDSKKELDALRLKDEETGRAKDLRSEKDSMVISKIRKHISLLKCRGIWPEDYSKVESHSQELLKIYTELHSRMSTMTMLDFDDILIYTVRLLQHNTYMSSIKHVLVDEFQDTNTVQMDLVRLFASQNKYTRDNITVVGDVDQSIYAFRGANSANFNIFQGKYPHCKVIKLKYNYRSTQDVLDASECFMREQKDRPSKNLVSQYGKSFPLVYRCLKSDYKEAEFIASEIKFLRSLPGLFKPKDFAILVRANYMTRVIEKELSTKGLPYSVVKGRAFWERKEVMAIIDLLKSVGRPQDRCAFIRSLLFVGEGVGSVTMKKISGYLETETKSGMTTLSAIKMIINGQRVIKGLNAKAKTSCANLVKLIEGSMSIYSSDQCDKSDVIALFEYFYQSDAIQKMLDADDEKVQNVKEIKTQLELFVPEDLKIEEDDNDTVETDNETPELTFLESFLSSIDIYTPEEVTEESERSIDPESKISISTIHGAKGLEWPIVFVVGVNEGQFPSGRTDDIITDRQASVNEDRRVFYVSTTRAKHLLYVTSNTTTSEFVMPMNTAGKLEKHQRAFKDQEQIKALYKLVGAPVPSSKELEKYHLLADSIRRERDEQDGSDLQGKNEYRYMAKSKSPTDTEQYDAHPKTKAPRFAPSYTPQTRITKMEPKPGSAPPFRVPLSTKNSVTIHNPPYRPPRIDKLSIPAKTGDNPSVKQEHVVTGDHVSHATSSVNNTASIDTTRPRKKTLGMKRRRF